ncbi:hypothetical protein BU26DRAFT_515451 [Trematosphaeria pertusa]|uniref:Uncharacterized protein n=1 Tax=Trematosphaeria pertusa TaxID=390896 RepID=A0A6A6IRH9_9PLEO|nr:uncharacterized protein BU26DRAFT_515451 [Trematosphaeria pertusa]KAF2253071.1 hypothetical protein BU26DRAFT_515451 [Trematosphaeria pertusa]
MDPSSYIGTQCRLSEEHNNELPDLGSAQSIPGRHINPTKLTALLRIKFGAGTYEVQIVQNSYCIIAPRKLSSSEIAECRRR